MGTVAIAENLAEGATGLGAAVGGATDESKNMGKEETNHFSKRLIIVILKTGFRESFPTHR